MSEPQLNLLGEPDQPQDAELGPVQRAAMRVIRRVGSMSRDEAGALAHAHRGKHAVDERCIFCPGDGALLLESLIRRGLVEAAGGDVRLRAPLAAAEPEAVSDDYDPETGRGIPY